MKSEIISFVAGAGVVGCVWAACVLFDNDANVKKLEPAKTVKAVDSKKTQPISRKPVKSVYSSLPDKNFSGLKLYESDFLVPLNRLTITEHVVFDDPKGNYGSGGAPMCAFMFRIGEKGKNHYFFTAGKQWNELSELVYLGEDITIKSVKPAGNGYIMATYKDKNGRDGNGFVAVSNTTGSEPAVKMGIAQKIKLDPLLKYAEKPDPFVWTINAAQFWQIYQKAIRENDKMTIAKMISFPMERNGERIYTRAEFIERFDEIYTKEVKERILKSDSGKIWYSWRGAGLPDGSWLQQADSKDAPAGPITF